MSILDYKISRLSSAQLFDLENKFGATNYAPIKVAIAHAKGVHVFDPEGKKYFDFLSAYSAVNQGHGHPKILDAAIEQMKVRFYLAFIWHLCGVYGNKI